MAIVANQNKNDNLEENSSTGPIGVSGSQAQSSPSSPQVGQGTQNSATPTNTSSGRFTNLQSYLNANQNNNLAGQVSNNLQNQGSNLQNQFNQNYNQFQNNVNQGTNQYNGSLVSNATSNPYAFSQNQQDVNQLNQMKGGQYTGPQGFDQNQQLAGQVQNYQQLANQTGTEQGRYGLLSNMFNNGNYNTGQQQLDNLFLQSNPNNVAQLQKSTANANSMASNLNNAEQNAGMQVQNARNVSAQTGQQVGNDLTNAVTQFTNGLNNQVGQDNTQAAANLTSVKNALASGNPIDNATLSTLGLDPTQSSYGLDLNSYLTPPTQATAGNVASTDQYNNYGALAKLAGVNPTLLDSSQQAQAGTWNSNPTFNTANFNSDVGQRQSALANAYTPDIKQSQDMLNQRQNLVSLIQQVQGDPGNDDLNQQMNNLAGQLYGTNFYQNNTTPEGNTNYDSELAYAQRGVGDQQTAYNNVAQNYNALLNQYNPSKTLGTIANPPPVAPRFGNIKQMVG